MSKEVKNFYGNHLERAHRAPTDGPSLKEQQIEEIVRLMCLQQWNPAKSNELRRQWDVSQSSIAHFAAEASRFIRSFARTNKDEMRAMIDQGLQFAIKGAAEAKQWTAVVKALEVQANLHGIMSPQQIDLRHELTTMSEGELESQKRALLEKVAMITPSPMQLTAKTE